MPSLGGVRLRPRPRAGPTGPQSPTRRAHGLTGRFDVSELWNSLLEGMGAVLAFFYAGIPSYGVAIIGLTVAVRLLLFPLTAKQTRSMQKMQVIQPEIKRIQAKYKDDRQKLNEEIMKYYKENKVNPLAGCVPLIAQMPIFFALFAVLRGPHKYVPAGAELYKAFCGAKSVAQCAAPPGPRGLGFLGMDLSKAPSAPHGGFLEAVPYFVLIGLVVATGYLQFKQTQSRQGAAQANPQAQMMGKIFPIMFAFISFGLPAGVVLYFLVSNAWQIGQQALIFGSLLPGGGPAAGAGPGPAKDAREAKDAKGTKVGGDGSSGGDSGGKHPPMRPPAVEKPGASRAGRSGDGGPGGPGNGFGRAQPSGSRPRRKRRRR